MTYSCKLDCALPYLSHKSQWILKEPSQAYLKYCFLSQHLRNALALFAYIMVFDNFPWGHVSHSLQFLLCILTEISWGLHMENTVYSHVMPSPSCFPFHLKQSGSSLKVDFSIHLSFSFVNSTFYLTCQWNEEFYKRPTTSLTCSLTHSGLELSPPLLLSILILKFFETTAPLMEYNFSVAMTSGNWAGELLVLQKINLLIFPRDKVVLVPGYSLLSILIKIPTCLLFPNYSTILEILISPEHECCSLTFSGTV